MSEIEKARFNESPSGTNYEDFSNLDKEKTAKRDNLKRRFARKAILALAALGIGAGAGKVEKNYRAQEQTAHPVATESVTPADSAINLEETPMISEIPTSDDLVSGSTDEFIVPTPTPPDGDGSSMENKNNYAFPTSPTEKEYKKESTISFDEKYNYTLPVAPAGERDEDKATFDPGYDSDEYPDSGVDADDNDSDKTRHMISDYDGLYELSGKQTPDLEPIAPIENGSVENPSEASGKELSADWAGPRTDAEFGGGVESDDEKLPHPTGDVTTWPNYVKPEVDDGGSAVLVDDRLPGPSGDITTWPNYVVPEAEQEEASATQEDADDNEDNSSPTVESQA